MKTEVIKPGLNDKKDIRKIAKVIKSGGLVIFPTETVYGLGANGFDTEAVKKIYKSKGRPQDNPLILHIGERNQLDELVSEIPKSAKKLMDEFWPGPLTLIFKKSSKVPDIVTGGLDSVAIRMPSNPIANRILIEAQVPVAAPSANISGRPSPTTVKHAIEDMDGKVDIIVEGGSAIYGIESTVLDVTTTPATILRPGSITAEAIEKVLGEVAIDEGLKNSNAIPKSPGQKYKHYAPKAEAELFVGSLDSIVNGINKKISQNPGKKIAVLATFETANLYENPSIVINLGSREDLNTIAAHLFDALRKCDEEEVDLIFAEGFELKGVGLGIMNRLIKACSGKVVLGV